MSEEQLKAFLEKVISDTSLLEKLKGAVDANAALSIAKEAGFIISAVDLKNAQSELSDTELESVTGGTYTGFPKPSGRCTVQVESTCLGGEPC